jgi:hypothetical protein
MAIVLTTLITLDPNNQLAHIADFTGLINTTQYVISGTYLAVDTRFTFHGFNDITLTKPPVGVPAPSTQVSCQISTVPVPAPPPPPAKYPYGTKDRLAGVNLNLDLSSNPGTAPPSSAHGRATQGKLWLDTSVTPAQLRVCAVATAQAGYVAGDWFTLANVAGGSDLGALYLPLTGGSLSGSLAVAGTINGYSLASTGIVYPAYGHAISFEWNGANLVGHVDGTGAPGALAILNQPAIFASLTVSGGITAGGGINATGNIVSGNTVQGANIVTGANFAGPSGYTFYGPGFGVASTIQFNASTTVALSDLQVNGTGRFQQLITVGGLTLQNNSGYLYSPSNMRTTGLVVDGSIVLAGTININGITIGNNAGYFYAPNMRTSSMLVDGDANISGVLSVGGNLGVGGAYLYLQNANAGNDIAANGVFRRSTVAFGGPKGARIECWGGDWDYTVFAMSGGSFNVSPDSGASGFYFIPSGGFSDARLKDTIRDTKVDALASILATPVRAFEWNEEGKRLMPHAAPEVSIGLVAQELEETMPAVVGVNELADGMRYINDQHLTPYLFRAIQQLAERVATLEAK